MIIFEESFAKYYQENKEKIQKKSHKRYENVTKGEAYNKQEYVCEQYKNISKTEKQRPVEYRKRYYEIQKDKLNQTNWNLQ